MFSKYEYCHYSAWNILGNSAWNILEQYDNWQVVLQRVVAIYTPLGDFHPAWSVRGLASTIIVLGFIQTSPIFICLASTIILLNVLGILYGILLAYIWGSTEKGKWFFRELWRSTLRLENFILPGA